MSAAGPDQQCPDPEGFKASLQATFDELRRLDEGAQWGDTAFRNSADTLGHVLEMVRLHKVSVVVEVMGCKVCFACTAQLRWLRGWSLGPRTRTLGGHSWLLHQGMQGPHAGGGACKCRRIWRTTLVPLSPCSPCGPLTLPLPLLLSPAAGLPARPHLRRGGDHAGAGGLVEQAGPHAQRAHAGAEDV